jgi:hypothetical protein
MVWNTTPSSPGPKVARCAASASTTTWLNATVRRLAFDFGAAKQRST